MLIARVARNSVPDSDRFALGTARDAEGAGYEPAILVAIRPAMIQTGCSTWNAAAPTLLGTVALLQVLQPGNFDEFVRQSVYVLGFCAGRTGWRLRSTKRPTFLLHEERGA